MGWWILEEKELLSDYVLLEVLDMYAPVYVNQFLEAEKYLDIDSWMQFRAIRTNKDLLVKFVNGEMRYFRLPDDEHCVTDDAYTSRIKCLAEKVGDNFVDVFKEDFFVNSRKLYQKLKEHKEMMFLRDSETDEKRCVGVNKMTDRRT